MATKTFTKSSGTANNWNATGNWSGATLPAAGDDVLIGNSGTTTFTALVNDGGRVANSVTLGDGTNAATLSITSSGTTAGSTSGQLTVTGNINVRAGSILSVTGGSAATAVNGGSLKAGSITAQGSGAAVVSITGVNSQVEVQTSLSVLNGAAAGNLTLTGAGAALILDGTQTLDTINISAFGANGAAGSTLQQQGAGTLTLGSHTTITHTAGTAAIAGNAVINQGTINASRSGGVFNITATQFSNSGLIAASNKDNVTIGAVGTSFTNTGSLTIANAAAGKTVVTVGADTFANQAGGTITISSGGQLFVGLSGEHWSTVAGTGVTANLGTITLLTGGELHVDGIFTAAQLGTINHTGGSFGTLFIDGDFDNTGNTLNGTSFAPVALEGGTIHHGVAVDTAIPGPGVNGLTFTTSGGTLDGLTYRGPMELTTAGANVTIENGLTATNAAGTGPGQIDIIANGAELDFDGTQTLDNVTVNLGGSGTGGVLAGVGAPSDTLTFGTGAILQFAANGTSGISNTGLSASIKAQNLDNKGQITDAKAGAIIGISSVGNFSNEGSITVSAAGSGFEQGAEIDVSANNFVNNGTIDVKNTNIFSMSVGSFTNGASGTILIENGGEAFVGANTGTWTNSGAITLQAGGTLHLLGSFSAASLGAGATNAGGTIFINGTLDNTGQTLDGVTGFFSGQLQLTGGIIHSGIVKSAAVKIFNATLDGVAFQGNLDLSATGVNATIINGLTAEDASGNLPGTVTVTGQAASLTFNDTETFNNATINLGSSTGVASVLAGGSGNTSAVLTLGPNVTVHHAGANAALAGAGTLINQGTIDASLSGGNFGIQVGNVLTPGTFTNQGLIHVSNGDKVTIANFTNFTNLSGTTLTGGHYEVDAGSTLQLADNTTIQTLNADVTLSGAGSVIQSLNTGTSTQVSFDSTLTTIDTNGQLHLINGRNFTSPNAITDNGLLDLSGTTFTAASLAVGATGTLHGFGTVATAVTNSGLIEATGGSLSLQGGLANLSGTTLTGGHYQVDPSSTLQLANNTQIQTLNADLTLNGAGSVVQGLNTGTSTQVTLESSLVSIGINGQLHLVNGRDFTATHAVTDSGLIQLAGTTFGALSLATDATGVVSGFGAIAAALTNAGLVEATAGGVLTLNNAVANTGNIQIDAGANLVLDGVVTGGGSVTFQTGADTLSVANAAFQANDLSNVIKGFGTDDKIDLTGISDATQADFNYATNTLTVSGGAGGPFTFHFDPSQSFAGDFFHLTSDGGSGLFLTEDSNPCYCRGTMILTDRGERAVEDLEIGDCVITGAGIRRPIKWIGRRSYSGRFILGRKDLLPICFRAGSLGENLPRRDLWISPHHAMYLEGVLIEARNLVNGVTIVQPAKVEQLEYFHIELDRHDIIVAEGALSESFIDDDSRKMFHNAHEYAVLYPNELTARPVYCAPRRDEGCEVETARRRIDALAGLTTREEAATAVRGFVDQVGQGAIAGWVSLENRPEQQVSVDVFAAGRFIGSAVANLYREDLADAGIGNGHHGFVLPLSAMIDPATITVRCTIADTTLPLSQDGLASLADAQMQLAA